MSSGPVARTNSSLSTRFVTQLVSADQVHGVAYLAHQETVTNNRPSFPCRAVDPTQSAWVDPLACLGGLGSGDISEGREYDVA